MYELKPLIFAFYNEIYPVWFVSKDGENFYCSRNFFDATGWVGKR